MRTAMLYIAMYGKELSRRHADPPLASTFDGSANYVIRRIRSAIYTSVYCADPPIRGSANYGNPGSPVGHRLAAGWPIGMHPKCVVGFCEIAA